MKNGEAEPVYAITESRLHRLEQLGANEDGDTESYDIGSEVRQSSISCNIMTCLWVTDMCMERNGAQGQQQILESLRSDLHSRFVPQNNQWCKGRNSGLLECCNIIDEHIATIQQGKQAQPRDAAGKRYIVIDRCFQCRNCVENKNPPSDFKIWACCLGKDQPLRPLTAPIVITASQNGARYLAPLRHLPAKHPMRSRN